MSEVATVAAITGGASVLTSGITGLITWAVSQRSSKVDLAKVGAEHERMQASHREEERRNRQSTYHQFIEVLNEIFQLLGTGTDDAWKLEVFQKYNHLLSGVLLFGPPSVRNGATELNVVYAKIWPAYRAELADHPEKPDASRWHDATAPVKDEFSACILALVKLMHADVTRGIAEDPAG